MARLAPTVARYEILGRLQLNSHRATRRGWWAAAGPRGGCGSGNGSESIGAALQGWLPEGGAEALPVAPGGPWENGLIESFPSRCRDAFLGREEFESVADARAKGQWFGREYNAVRPHSAPSYKTPKGFSAECDRGWHGQPPPNGKG